MAMGTSPLLSWYMVGIDSSTKKDYDLNISYGDMLCFGFANMLLAILVFGILSLLMKWWSKNSSNSPF